MAAIDSPYRQEGLTLLRGPRHPTVPSTQTLYFEREFSVKMKPDKKLGNEEAPAASAANTPSPQTLAERAGISIHSFINVN